MLNYCSRICEDKGTEVCALPTITERTVRTAVSIGARLLDACSTTAAAWRGVQLGPDPMGIIQSATDRTAVSFTASEACAYLHKMAEVSDTHEQ
jgi:hypothetical protein